MEKGTFVLNQKINPDAQFSPNRIKEREIPSESKSWWV